ncbi:MAG: hypothetical protein JO306_00595 [Gemmatimonadetes bacterium]|nr:hypothetical protein [Gemmatimonadota bacterium]
MSLDAPETARAFVDALNAGRWREAAALVLPAHAERHRLIELSQALGYAQERERGRAVDNTTPFTIRGEYEVDEAELQRLSGALVPGYRGAATVGDVAEIAADEMMAQVLENAMMRGPAVASPRRQRMELGRVEADGAHAARLQYRVDPAGSPGIGEGPYLRTMEMRFENGRWYVLPGLDLLSEGTGTWTVLRWIFEAAVEQNRASGF